MPPPRAKKPRRSFSTAPPEQKQKSPAPAPWANARVIFGDVQAGKTAEIVATIQRSSELCIVVVRNTSVDVRQFMQARLQACIALAAARFLHRMSHRVTPSRTEARRSSLGKACVQACKRAGLPAATFASNTGVKRMSCGVLARPKVLVLLANAASLCKGLAEVRLYSTRFTLIVDEADKLLFSTEGGERSLRAEMDRLRDAATDVVMVTATMFNFMTSLDVGGTLPSSRVTVLEARQCYCGLHDVLFGCAPMADPIMDPTCDSYIPEEELNPDASPRHALPASALRWLRRLADPAGDLEQLAALGHPVLALLRVGSRLDTIAATARAVLGAGHGCMPIVYCGEGVAIPDGSARTLAGLGRPVGAARYRRIPGFTVVTVTLQELLTVLKDSGLCGAGSVIVVCAGMLAARGVNFTDSTFRWATTHEYFLPSKSTCVTELHQGLRILGNKPWPAGSFTPVVTTKFSVMRNIQVGARVQQRALSNLRAGGVSLKRAVEDVELEFRPTVRYASNMAIGAVRGTRL